MRPSRIGFLQRGLLLFALGAGTNAHADGAADLQSLGWFSGCWAGDGEEAGTGESWSTLAGGTMLGMARTVKNGRTIAHEFVQIRLDEQGRVVYIAQPSGQAETSFTLRTTATTTTTDLPAHHAVFENPQHDFPQRVIYRREGDKLVGRIEGVDKGTEKGFDFPMHRTPCP
jgi:hypothetical protein